VRLIFYRDGQQWNVSRKGFVGIEACARRCAKARHNGPRSAVRRAVVPLWETADTVVPGKGMGHATADRRSRVEGATRRFASSVRNPGTGRPATPMPGTVVSECWRGRGVLV